MKPLENMIVLDFSQYLAGPSAASGLPIWGPVSSKLTTGERRRLQTDEAAQSGQHGGQRPVPDHKPE